MFSDVVLIATKKSGGKSYVVKTFAAIKDVRDVNQVSGMSLFLCLVLQ